MFCLMSHGLLLNTLLAVDIRTTTTTSSNPLPTVPNASTAIAVPTASTTHIAVPTASTTHIADPTASTTHIADPGPSSTTENTETMSSEHGALAGKYNNMFVTRKSLG